MTMERRSFLGGTAVGIVGALVPRVVRAQRRVLGGSDGVATELASTGGRVSPELRRFLSGVRVGTLARQGSLVVLWLTAEPPASAFDVVTLEEARSRGALVITEHDQARVPDLVVENRGKTHVVLLAGEILLGGKQNRVLAEDLLLPPLSGPRRIGVYCVEQGRWQGRSREFESRASFAPPALRSRVMEKADQGRVWAEVDRYSQRAAAASPTGSHQQVYEQPAVKAHLTAVERGVEEGTMPGALGAVVFVGPGLAGIDLFDDRSLFAREWPKLLRAYAVESYGTGPGTAPDEDTLRARVESLLQRAGHAEGVAHGNAGEGRIFEYVVDRYRGSALIFEGRVLHAAIT